MYSVLECPKNTAAPIVGVVVPAKYLMNEKKNEKVANIHQSGWKAQTNSWD